LEARARCLPQSSGLRIRSGLPRLPDRDLTPSGCARETSVAMLRGPRGRRSVNVAAPPVGRNRTRQRPFRERCFEAHAIPQQASRTGRRHYRKPGGAGVTGGTIRASCSSDATAAESSGNDSKSRVRRIDQLVESLGLRVFDIRVQPDHQPARRAVQAFRERPREGRYPNLFVDGTIVSNSLNGS
jgi:hypothetical protein